MRYTFNFYWLQATVGCCAFVTHMIFFKWIGRNYAEYIAEFFIKFNFIPIDWGIGFVLFVAAYLSWCIGGSFIISVIRENRDRVGDSDESD